MLSWIIGAAVYGIGMFYTYAYNAVLIYGPLGPHRRTIARNVMFWPIFLPILVFGKKK
jgi:hypothetical protein